MASDPGAPPSQDRLRDCLDMPWKVRLEVERIAAAPLARLVFALAGVRYGRRWRLYGVPILQRHRRSTMVLGDGLQLRCSRISNPLSPWHPTILATRCAGSVIEVGRDVSMTGGTICAVQLVRIGDRVSIGANCTIADSDFHPLGAEARACQSEGGESAPIVIEDDVFIGMQSVVLKGVRLGAGCVVGACSVVTRDVPAGAVVAGNPARVVGEVRGIVAGVEAGPCAS